MMAAGNTRELINFGRPRRPQGQEAEEQGPSGEPDGFYPQSGNGAGRGPAPWKRWIGVAMGRDEDQPA